MLKELFRLDLSLDPSTLSFSKDGAYLIIGSEVPEDANQNDGYVAIDVWDIASRSLRIRLSNKQNSRRAIQSVNLVEMNSDNQTVVSAHNSSGGIQVWNTASPGTSIGALNTSSNVYIHAMSIAGDRIHVMDHLNQQYALSLDDLSLINACQDIPPETQVDEQEYEHEYEAHNNMAAFSPDGQFILLEADTADETEHYLEYRSFLSPHALWKTSLYSSDELVKHACFSPDGQRIYCAGNKSVIEVYNSQNGLIDLQAKTNAATSAMHLSQDGSILAELFNTGVGFSALDTPYDLYLRDAHSLDVIATAKVPPGCITDMKIAPDKRSICVTWARLIDRVYFNQVIFYDISEALALDSR